MYRIDDTKVLTPELLGDYISKHKGQIVSRYSKLINAYKGDYDVLHMAKKASYKPDNRLVVNFAKYIVDTFNGFFIGNPIKTTSDDTRVADAVERIQNLNDQDDNNAELAKMMSIYGHAFEMYFVDEDKDIGITYLSPLESFMIYDESIIGKPRYFVRFYTNTDGDELGSVSDATMIYFFKRTDGDYRFVNEQPHGFDGVPATEFIENEERMGIYESVMTLMNAYNKALSEKANDVDYFADAYLKILGAKLTPEDLKDLRNQRIINLEGGIDGNLIVEFMEKPSADGTQENLLNKLERLIYQIAMVPNINDENFGTSSGIAMQYKLLNTHNLFRTKQRKFESGMNNRWKLIFSNPVVTEASKDDFAKLRYRFTPNIPANALEESQTAANVSGMVSRRTQLEILSFVDNVDEEMERIKKEEEENTPALLEFDAHKHEEKDEEPVNEQ